MSADLVSHMHCPHCDVWWDFSPPRWLGDPWTRHQADRLLARHIASVHPALKGDTK